MRFTWVLCACALLARQPGVKAQVAGSTLAQFSGNPEGRIDLTGSATLVFHSKTSDLRIPYDRIDTLEYGQRVSRRYVEAILISPMLMLSKSRKHFVTVGFTDAAGVRQAVVLRVGKSDIRAVLAGLEAKTGRRVEYQDEDARQRGRD